MPTGPDPRPPAAGSPPRNLVFAGLAALLVVFVGMTLRGGPVAGAIAPAIGAAALVFRWSAMPVVFVVLLAYLLVFPFGVPYATAAVNDIADSGFRVQDMLLTAAALLYLACQYRVLGLPRKADADVPEPAFRSLLVTVAVLVVAGQVVWLGLTSFSVDLRAVPPVRFGGPNPFGGPQFSGPFAVSAPGSRVLLLAAAVVAGGFAAWFAFWYRRLARLTPDEARMMLQDTGWREARRELNRQEMWRAWGRERRVRKSGGAP